MRWVKLGRDFVFPDYRPKYPRDPPFDLLEVKADITVDLEKRSIYGSVINILRALRDTYELRLDAVGMYIKEVSVPGREYKYLYDGNTLEIFLTHPVKRGEEIEVRINYEVERPLKGVWFIPVDSGSPAKQAWTQGEPEDTRYWLPTYDFPDRKARVTLNIRARKGLTVLANGELTGRYDEGDYTVWSFRINRRIPTYLVAFAIGDFYIKEEKYGNILLQYAVPRGREGDIDRSFSKTRDMIEFFEEYIGVKYPYPKYTQVCVDEFVVGGMENASITLLTSATLHDEKAHIDFRSEPLVSHELAHQWFGDLVTCRDWSHIWLNESFATLMAALWRRRELGEEWFTYDLIRYMDSYLGEYRSRYARPIVMRLFGDPFEVFDAHSYPKGALILWTLANLVGENTFRAAIKTYLERYSDGVADTEDLRKVFEEVSGTDLSWFFEQYIYNAGHPVLKVSWKWREKDRILELKVTQVQKDDSLETYRLPLEVLFITGDKEEGRSFWVEEKQHVFPIPLDKKPRAVCIDPKFKAFKDIDLDVGVEELLSIVRYCTYLYPRVVAVRKLGSKGGTRVSKELGELVTRREEFWGLRAEAAKALGKIGGEYPKDILLKSLDIVEEPRVRRAIVEALGNFKDEKVGEKLASILEDSEESYYVRASAAISLAKTGYSNAFRVLKKALSYPSHNDVILVNVLEGLSILGTEEALEIVLSYTTSDKKPHIRAAAAQALGNFPVSRKVVEALEYLSKSLHPRVRRGVIEAAKRSLSPRLIPLLDKLRGDIWGSNARVAREARKKLEAHLERGEEYRKLREEIERIRGEERRLAERLDIVEKRLT